MDLKYTNRVKYFVKGVNNGKSAIWKEERIMRLRGLLLRSCTKKMTIKHFIVVSLSGHQSGKAHTFVEGIFPDMGGDCTLLCVFHCWSAVYELWPGNWRDREYQNLALSLQMFSSQWCCPSPQSSVGKSLFYWTIYPHYSFVCHVFSSWLQNNQLTPNVSSAVVKGLICFLFYVFGYFLLWSWSSNCIVWCLIYKNVGELWCCCSSDFQEIIASDHFFHITEFEALFAWNHF